MIKKVISILPLLFFLSASQGCSEKPSVMDNTPDSLLQGKKLDLIWKAPKTFDGSFSYTKVTPYFFENKVIVAYENTIQCLNKNTGTEIWRYTNNTDKNVTFCNARNFIREENYLYGVMGRALLVCLNINDGSLKWKYLNNEYGFAESFSYLCQSPDALFLVRDNDKRLVAISKQSGQELWMSKETSIPHVSPLKFDSLNSAGSEATYYNGKLFVSAALIPANWPEGNCSLAIFDAASGELLHMKVYPYPDSTIGFPLWKNLVYAGNDNPLVPLSDGLLFPLGYAVVKIDTSGNIIWQTVPYIDYAVSPMQHTFLQIYNNIICGFDNGDGNCFAFGLDLQSGKQVWTRRMNYDKTGHTILFFTPTISDGVIYKVTDDLWLYAIDCTTGALKYASPLVAPLASYGLPQEAYEGALGVDSGNVYFSTFNYIVSMKPKE
jgi:outer membrane protein assembly factor BamB